MLKPGDIVCPKCNGTGEGKKWVVDEFEITPECNHCRGDGKFDWIERIMGKRRLPFDYEGLSVTAAQHLADQIDKQVLENIAADMKKLKEEQHDNRIFSELMLCASHQPIFKSETD